MKQELSLYASQLNLPVKANGNEWFDSMASYLKVLDKLITEKVSDEERIAYGDALAIALYQLSKYTSLARKERDRALAAGYLKYPKGEFNSDAQVALARNHASEETRLRGLLEEIEAAIKLRATLNQTALVTYRQMLARE